MAEVARSSRISVVYGNVDISEEVSRDLVLFNYRDNNEQLDSVSITVENTDNKWLDLWLPDKSATLEIKIEYESGVLNCGKFSVDEIEGSSKPSEVILKAVSIDVNSTLQEQRKTKSFEDATLREVAEEIASEAGFSIGFFADDTEKFKRLDQQEESDLAFLRRVCKLYNLQIKVKNDQIVIWSVDQFISSRSITPDLDVSRWEIRTKTKKTYSKCTVQYFDQQSNTVFKHTAKDPAATIERELSIKQKVSSAADAQKVAESSLSAANKLTAECNVDCRGETQIVSGATIELNFFGRLSGVYLIRSTIHRIDRLNGYRTSFKAAKQ